MNSLYKYLVFFYCISFKFLNTGSTLQKKVDINAEIMEIKRVFKEWTNSMSKELSLLTELARKEKVEESFSNSTIIEEKWSVIAEEVAGNIREMMSEKVEAVKAIKNHAELLSLYRKPDLGTHSGYDFYLSDDLNLTSGVENRSKDLFEQEKLWKCAIPHNISKLCYENFPAENTFSFAPPDHNTLMYEQILNQMSLCNQTAFLPRPENYYRDMNLVYDPHFDENVNAQYSIIKVTPSVDNRSEEVLNGIRWSEALDLTFKCNLRRDPTLTWQYFGSPLGFLRFYPAMKWSDEEYYKTFDFRLRSWYIEAISSAKDIIILLDRSGSMESNSRSKISKQIVNSILDTLTDNDYVNVYTFTNFTKPLVGCFSDTLVQANEENLRLLRETLDTFNNTFCSNITLGLEKAFPILWKYREARMGSLVCNQAIMLITEGLDYEYNEVLFKIFNHLPSQKYYRPIRVFTYLLGTELSDAERLKWIACTNMGFFVNVTVISEVREKVLKYLEVLSRPINLTPKIEPEPAWSALYVHLADRRLSNFLWKKHEGNKQRDVFIQFEKQRIKDRGKILKINQTHFTLQDEHDYKKYLERPEYIYLTSVSLPVLDRRPNQTSLLGVAAVDIPLDYIKKLAEPHRIGVNGYSFTITNNGYVLYHPDHQTEFKANILKPTFNRVDFTEVEISDDTIVPRKFDDAIIELRRNIVLQKKGSRVLKVRAPIDKMRRVMLTKRHYFYTKIGPFSLGIALPDGYGFYVTRLKTQFSARHLSKRLKSSNNWRVHPKWLYTCKTHRHYKSPEQELLHFIDLSKKPVNCKLDLITALLKDVNVTDWFENDDEVFRNNGSPYLESVVLTFVATHSGLTRWKNLNAIPMDSDHFANKFNKASEETYYRRSAEINYQNPDLFIYSVPFEEYDEKKTVITASNVVFRRDKNKRAPVAAVGFQILHHSFNKIMDTLRCRGKNCKIQCAGPKSWNCFVLDSDAYIILANNTAVVGKSLADVDKPLLDMMIKAGVFKEITVFDYQATCYPDYTSKEKFYGPTAEDVRKDSQIKCATNIKCKTIEYLRRQIKKTVPTPCDVELRMYNYLYKEASRLHPSQNPPSCACPFITRPIEGTNLLLVAAEGICCYPELNYQPVNPYPLEILYNMTLPCHIAVNNNFTKRHYTKCIIQNEKEFKLNENTTFCGVPEIIPRP